MFFYTLPSSIAVIDPISFVHIVPTHYALPSTIALIDPNSIVLIVLTHTQYHRKFQVSKLAYVVA